MGTGFLIDTNAVIDFLKFELPSPSMVWMTEMANRQLHTLSVITRIELWSRPGSPDETQRVVRYLRGSSILPLDEPVIQETIRLRQLYRRKLPDAIIAATALTHGLTLLTRNEADFRGIAGLTVLNPHEADRLPGL